MMIQCTPHLFLSNKSFMIAKQLVASLLTSDLFTSYPRMDYNVSYEPAYFMNSSCVSLLTLRTLRPLFVEGGNMGHSAGPSSGPHGSRAAGPGSRSAHSTSTGTTALLKAPNPLNNSFIAKHILSEGLHH